MKDGSIEAWIYFTGSLEQTVGLWLRTGNHYPVGKATFSEGFSAIINNYQFRICRWDGSNWYNLDSEDIDKSYSDMWLKVKFSIDDTKLSAILTSSTGLLIKKLSATNTNINKAGKPGFSVSTNFDDPNFIYMDNIKLITYDDKSMNWRRYHDWMPIPPEDPLIHEPYHPVQGSHYGEGLDICSIFAATHIGWNPFIDEKLDENYEFAGTSNACPLVSGIIALNYQYWKQEHGTKLTVYRFLERNEEGILVNTGDPEGIAPTDNGEDPEGWSGYYIQKSKFYGHGLIDAYEIYCFLRDNW
jgi:hypothetical protein